MNSDNFNQQLLAFLHASPTPFHAVATMAKTFDQAGFIALDEGAEWQLQAGKKYYVTRNGSAIIGFVVGKGPLPASGIRMAGAHTDSPCLKVKPHPELNNHGYYQVGVEVYGGVLMNPWFDRDLSLAGRITYRSTQGQLQNALIDFKRPIAIIPSLAIHLDREANKNRSVNPQKDLPPVLMQVEKSEKPDFRQLLLEQLNLQYPEVDADAVLDYELSFYDVQAPAIVGLQGDFIASARLDNLLSCFVEMRALIDADTDQSALLVCNDHEEVGSSSACGAQGPMLKSTLERWIPDIEQRSRTIDNSMMVSVDNAHGIHPNFADKHDGNHGPLLNKGPVIKVNANQRYASNSETSAVFRHLCELCNVPVQAFVSRTDLGCGSTIGPITATEVGVKTLDVGVPTFAMHSVRELAGTEDPFYLYQVLLHFYQLERLPNAAL